MIFFVWRGWEEDIRLFGNVKVFDLVNLDMVVEVKYFLCLQMYYIEIFSNFDGCLSSCGSGIFFFDFFFILYVIFLCQLIYGLYW